MKLPKLLEADERAGKVRAALEKDAKPLWDGGNVPVARVAASDAVVRSFALAAGRQQVRQGLEQATRRLDTEQRGLEAARAKAGAANAERVSRLLAIGPGGSTRFYRDCEALLRRHADRLLGLRFDDSFAAIGGAVVGKDAVVKVVLVDDKDAVAEILLALA